MDLLGRERLGLGELLGEFLEHGTILRTENGRSKRKVQLIVP
jgi:hypothetical protein